MNDRLTIDFTGLCVFVTNNAPEKLSVILAADPTGKTRHRPFLSINMRNVSPVSRGMEDQVIQLPDGNQIASWPLDQCIVRLTGGEGAEPGRIVLCGEGNPPSRCPQGPVSEMGLCWIPSLKRVSGHGNLNPVYLADKPVPHGRKSALAARVDLTCGYLYANVEVNRQAPHEYWTFDDGTGAGVSQYLADTVRLEMRPVPNRPVAIEITHFGNGSTKTLELERWEQRIELSITNLPGGMAEHAHDVQDGSSMTHFGIYYELLDPVPQKKIIPRRPDNPRCWPTPGAEGSMDAVEIGIQGVRPVICTPGLVP